MRWAVYQHASTHPCTQINRLPHRRNPSSPGRLNFISGPLPFWAWFSHSSQNNCTTYVIYTHAHLVPFLQNVCLFIWETHLRTDFICHYYFLFYWFNCSWNIISVLICESHLNRITDTHTHTHTHTRTNVHMNIDIFWDLDSWQGFKVSPKVSVNRTGGYSFALNWRGDMRGKLSVPPENICLVLFLCA